jgi:hypothetical protein
MTFNLFLTLWLASPCIELFAKNATAVYGVNAVEQKISESFVDWTFQTATGIYLMKACLPCKHRCNTLDAICWQKWRTRWLTTCRSNGLLVHKLLILVTRILSRLYATHKSKCSISFYSTAVVLLGAVVRKPHYSNSIWMSAAVRCASLQRTPLDSNCTPRSTSFHSSVVEGYPKYISYSWFIFCPKLADEENA